MNIKWFVIVNPTSGNDAAKKQWPLIKNELLKQYFEFDFIITNHKNHAIEIVQNALKQGYKNIICVGGDGTLHTIVNGILSLKYTDSLQHTSVTKLNKQQEIKLGIIPIGTGNDWIKTYKIPLDYKKAIAIIKEQHTVYQDIGKIIFTTTQQTIYFNNLAGIGFDGYVVHKVHKYKNLGFLAYLAGALVSIINFKKPELNIEFNKTRIQQKTLMLLIGICKYSGGGMQLTKNPDPTDGLFDISIVKNIYLYQIITNILGLFNGNIASKKFVKTFKTNNLKVTILNNNKTYIQADGEVIETGDFTVSMLQNELCFIVPDNTFKA